MAELYWIGNGVMPTMAALVAPTTVVAIRTELQIKLGASITNRGKVVEWGISFNGSAAATPIACELLTTGTVAATVTTLAATSVVNLDPAGVTVTDTYPFDWGTAATGFTASGEGTITAIRELDVQFVAPTNQYIKQWPLGREPMFLPTEYLRVRITAGATTWKVYTYVVVEV